MPLTIEQAGAMPVGTVFTAADGVTTNSDGPYVKIKNTISGIFDEPEWTAALTKEEYEANPNQATSHIFKFYEIGQIVEDNQGSAGQLATVESLRAAIRKAHETLLPPMVVLLITTTDPDQRKLLAEVSRGMQELTRHLRD